MRRMTAKKLLCAGDDDLLRDLFFNVNQKGIALISSAFQDSDVRERQPLTDAYLSQRQSFTPFRVHISLAAFKGWYPDKTLRRRMIGLLNKSFCGREDNDYEVGLYLDSYELPAYLDGHRFISLRAEEFETEWTRLASESLEGREVAKAELGWSIKARWDQLELSRTIEKRDQTIQELQAEILVLKKSQSKGSKSATT